MSKISEQEKWNLKTGDFVIETDSHRSACLLMKVTKMGDTGIRFDRVQTLFEDGRRIFDYERSEMFLLEEGDISDICVSTLKVPFEIDPQGS